MPKRIAVVTGAAGGMGRAIVDRLTEDLARRYARQKIAVNSLAPAMTETPLFDVLTADMLARAISAMPHGEAMQPDQIAG